MRFNLVRGEEIATVTVYHNGEMYTADEKHPAYHEIVARCLSDDESAIEFFDVSKAIEKKFNSLSKHVTTRHGHIYYDGDEVKDIITEHILRFMEQNEPFEPLVNFLEKLHSNPNPHSVEHLYRWLTRTGGFAISPAGNIIGYKGVIGKRPPAELGVGEYKSTHAGYALVNGVETDNKPVVQKVGDTVSMPRSKVTFDPKQGCSFGLHVGTFEYAKTYGDTVIDVEVDPRDVVSVPTDHSDKKMRCCSYKFLRVNNGTKHSTVLDKLPK